MKPIDYIYKVFLANPTIVIDSRLAKPGSIFFALKGDNTDGNRYAADAIGRGAALAVIDNPEYANYQGCVLVDSSLETLQQLATWHRKQLTIPFIGLTGSNGKTTTKELLHASLVAKYRTFATQGNLNNHIGVPLSVLSVTSKHQIAVVEMGANHIGEIAQLCSIAQPTHGLITNVGMAHLEGFGSFEGVKKAKGELYDYLADKEGVVFISRFNSELQGMLKSRSVSPSRVEEYGDGQTRVYINKGREPYITVEFNAPEDNRCRVDTNLAGSYNADNILAAYTLAHFFGVSTKEVCSAVEAYQPSNSRSQLLSTSKNRVVLDAYNANPTSMVLALNSFADIPTDGKKIVLLGEMLELGSQSAQEHQQVAKLACSLGFGMVVLVGSAYSPAPKGCLHFTNLPECIEYFATNSLRDALLLIKGSRGAKMEDVLKVF